MAEDMSAPVVMTMVRLRERHSDLMREYGAFDDEPTPAFIEKIIAFQTAACAAGVGISSSDERFEAQSKISYWQTARINAGQRPATMLLADFDQEAARRQAGDRSPYKGLAPFLTRDSKFFAGRYELVGRLVAKVKAMRLLALTGLSGSGKSSVIRAGLIPDLADGAYDGIDDDGLTNSSYWKYPEPILPGADPLQALEAIYGPIATPDDLPAALDRQGEAVLLSIDQFEEVFTLSPAGDRRTLFLDALVAAATSGTYRHVVVITMRSEFDTFVESHAAFGALFTAGREVIQAMQASDLRKVIEEPANRLGVGFEPGLVDELLTRVQGEPAGLPLLSFTLLKLWEMRDGGLMKLADYQALGGNPRDILANSADKVFEAFLKQDQDLARGIFTRLVKIGDSLEATSMRITRADLDVLGARDNVNRVLDILVDEGLLRTSPAPPERAATDKAPGQDPNSGWWITPETQIEVAHEALIRNWGRLTEWVKDSFAEQTNRKAFALRAQKWREGTGDLLSGMSLDEAKSFPEKSPVEAEYIAASVRHAIWRQRRIWAVTAVIAALAIAASILSIRLLQIGKAREEARQADTAFAAAETLIDRGDVTLAKKLLFQSLPDDADLPPRVTALLQAAELNTLKQDRLTDPDLDQQRAAAYAKAAAAEADTRSEAKLLARFLRRNAANAGVPLSASVSADGSRVISIWNDGKARVWMSDGAGFDARPIVLALPDPNRKILAALMIDNESAVSVGHDDINGTTSLDYWAIDGTGQRPPALKRSVSYDNFQSGTVSSIMAHPTRPILVISFDNGGYALVDQATGQVEHVSEMNFAKINSAVFSPKGDKLLLAFDDGWVRIDDVRTHATDLNFQIGTRPATSGRYSPTGARFAVGSADGIIRIYQASDGKKLYELAGHRSGVTGIDFSSDGATLISSAKDGTMRFWELGVNAGRLLRTLTPTEAVGHTKPVNSIAYAPDGEHIVVAVGDGSIRVLGTNGGKLVDEKKVGKVTDDFDPSVFVVSADRSVMIANTDLSDESVKQGRKNATGSDTPETQYDLIDLHTGASRASWQTINASNFYDAKLSDDSTRLVYTRSLADNKSWWVEARATTPDAKPVPIVTLSEFPALTAVSPDGRMIVTIDNQGYGRLSDATGRFAAKPLEPFNQSGSMFGATLISAFSNQGLPRFAVAYGSDTRFDIYIYSLANGQIIRKIEAVGGVASLQFAPNGKTLFVGGDNGSGAIHDTGSGALLKRLDGSHDSGITFARFSANGKVLITGSTDATARLWSVATGQLLQTFRGHKATVAFASLSPNGDRLITESDDLSVMVWDTGTGRQLTVLRGPTGSDSIWGLFAADGNTVQTLSDFPATLRTWNVGAKPYRYADLRHEACKDGGVISKDDLIRNSLTLVSPLPKCAGLKARK